MGTNVYNLLSPKMTRQLQVSKSAVDNQLIQLSDQVQLVEQIIKLSILEQTKKDRQTSRLLLKLFLQMDLIFNEVKVIIIYLF